VFADGRRAGEIDFAHQRMTNQRVANLARGAGDDVDDAGGSILAMICKVIVGTNAEFCAGFTTTVFPVISACGSLAPRIDNGQFHGTIRAATPRGWRITMVSNGGPLSSSSAARRSA
jgi:hypothetical protein